MSLVEQLRQQLEAQLGAGRGSMALVEAPGRVNLMGDHIDYNGLAVLPMAIEHRVSMVVRPRQDSMVRLVNQNANFSARQFFAAERITPDSSGDWSNYVRAAVQGLHGRTRGRGFDAAIGSSIPVASGLSSSSALVVAAALAFLHANDVTIPVLELAELLAGAERYVGTRGGGMDQATCLAAREGAACRIEFGPLRVAPIPVPVDWRFVVASSLVRAEKSGPARATYNLRTRECAEALRAVRNHLGVAGPPSYPALLAHRGHDDLVDAGERILGDPLRRRFRHVIRESARVTRAEHALRAGQAGEFGSTMNESHASLRDDFEVSAPELESLVAAACDGGATGARLTGAGLGGCIVALCTAGTAPAVIDTLDSRFYATKPVSSALERYRFVSAPAAGARVSPL